MFFGGVGLIRLGFSNSLISLRLFLWHFAMQPASPKLKGLTLHCLTLLWLGWAQLDRSSVPPDVSWGCGIQGWTGLAISEGSLPWWPVHVVGRELSQCWSLASLHVMGASQTAPIFWERAIQREEVGAPCERLGPELAKSDITIFCC